MPNDGVRWGVCFLPISRSSGMGIQYVVYLQLYVNV